MKRGAVKKADSRLINLYVPNPLVVLADQAVVELDSDRSKFIRQAMREKLERHGIKVPKGVAA